MNPFAASPASLRFSVAVSGQSDLIGRFVEILGANHRGVTVYDRNAEAARDDARAAIPRHPQVADVEAVFGCSGAREMVTLRSRTGHRYFNFSARSAPAAKVDIERFLQRVVDALPALLQAPRA